MWNLNNVGARELPRLGWKNSGSGLEGRLVVVDPSITFDRLWCNVRRLTVPHCLPTGISIDVKPEYPFRTLWSLRRICFTATLTGAHSWKICWEIVLRSLHFSGAPTPCTKRSSSQEIETNPSRKRNKQEKHVDQIQKREIYDICIWKNLEHFVPGSNLVN